MTRRAVRAARNECPKVEEHTPEPEGYIAWHSWAEEMSKTHRQVRHEPCGLFKVWVALTEDETGGSL